MPGAPRSAGGLFSTSRTDPGTRAPQRRPRRRVPPSSFRAPEPHPQPRPGPERPALTSLPSSGRMSPLSCLRLALMRARRRFSSRGFRLYGARGGAVTRVTAQAPSGPLGPSTQSPAPTLRSSAGCPALRGSPMLDRKAPRPRARAWEAGASPDVERRPRPVGRPGALPQLRGRSARLARSPALRRRQRPPRPAAPRPAGPTFRLCSSTGGSGRGTAEPAGSLSRPSRALWEGRP